MNIEPAVKARAAAAGSPVATAQTRRTIMAKIMQFSSASQLRLYCHGQLTDYPLLMILASAPVALSRWIRIAETRSAFVQRTSIPCLGYWERPNWMSMILLLPAALWFARFIAGLLFGKLSEAGKYTRIPDLIADKQEEAKRRFTKAFRDGRNLVVAILITLGINILDMWDTLVPYAQTLKGATVPLQEFQNRWDWSLWFLSNPADHSLFWKNLLLVVLAYACQFGATLLAVSLIILLLRHNLFYLQSIYLRDRAQHDPVRPMVPLDFDAPDRCFGFHSLFMVFNVQLLVLAAAGAFTLISRATNGGATALSGYLEKLTQGDFKFSEFWSALFGNLPALFPTVGQRLFPLCWLGMFLVVLLPAFAKLLPLARLLRRNEVDARDYLLEFIPPESRLAQETSDLQKSDDVDRVAAGFSQQSFWPVSQTSAEFFSVAAFFVFFLILAPVFTWHIFPGLFLFYGLLLVMSLTCSAALFAAFRYMLRLIDPRLVGKGA
jgi:hypothetical protein